MNNDRNRHYSALISELKREREKVKKLSAMTELTDDKLWELVKDNRAVKDRIITEYISALASNGAIALIGRAGHSALTPVPRPKNLEDAKRLADKIIRS